jgi:hypothetical protein
VSDPRLDPVIRVPKLVGTRNPRHVTCCEPASSPHTPCGLAVAAIRFGSTEAEVGLTRLGRYFTWGAFGLLSPVLMGEELVEEDLSAMATARCRGFGLVGSYVGSR